MTSNPSPISSATDERKSREGIRTVSGNEIRRWRAAWEHVALRPEALAQACSVCGVVGDPVGSVTVAALIRRDLKPGVAGEGFRYCRTQHCPIVWYRNDPPFFVDVTEIRVPVNVKLEETSRPLCYCLKVSEAQVLEEVVGEGCCTTLGDVQRFTRANTGRACDVTNPSGECCEPDVRAVIAKGLVMAGRTQLIEPVSEAGDCCALPRSALALDRAREAPAAHRGKSSPPD